MDPYQTARSLDDLGDFDGLLESYLGASLSSLQPPPQQQQATAHPQLHQTMPMQPPQQPQPHHHHQPQQQQQQQHPFQHHPQQRPGDPSALLMANPHMQTPGLSPGPGLMQTAPMAASQPGLMGGPTGAPGVGPAPGMLGGLSAHGQAQTPGMPNLADPTTVGLPAGGPGLMGGSSAYGAAGSAAHAGSLAALGAGLGGGLSQLEAFLGLQAVGMGGGGMGGSGGMLPPRTSITTAAGLGMGGGAPGTGAVGGLGQIPGGNPLMAGGGFGGLAGLGAGAGMYGGIGGLSGAMAAAMAAAGGAAASGGGKVAGGRRSRGGQAAGGMKASRRSEPDFGSSDGELDSNSDSGSSDGEPQHKNNKKKREGGGGGGPEDEAERRHAALQEKNRKAQRRFRERQKTKLMELHKQIEELAGKVSNLQTENAALHSRTSILEKVLDMRNEQIQVMQENKEVTDAELGSLGSGGPQALVPLTPEAIKELSSEDIYRVYQTYVKELSVRLVEVSKGAGSGGAEGGGTGGPDGGGEGGGSGGTADGRSGSGSGGDGGGGGEAGGAGAGPGQQQPASAAQAELERVVRELSVTLMRLGVARPLEARKFIVFSRQYLGNTEKEVIELWKNVMKHIELTPEQMREIVELKRMFLTKIEPIMEERKHLNISIQTNLPHDTYHTKSSISYIKAHEAVSKLRDNLRSEQHVVLEFAIAVFRGVFRPAQMAALLVRCYPAVPDALGIASALATELGEPDSPATQQLTMQLGGYAVPGAQPQGGAAGGMLSIHPSLMPMDVSTGVGQQLLQQQQQAAQQLLQQQQQAAQQLLQQQQQLPATAGVLGSSLNISNPMLAQQQQQQQQQAQQALQGMGMGPMGQLGLGGMGAYTGMGIQPQLTQQGGMFQGGMQGGMLPGGMLQGGMLQGGMSTMGAGAGGGMIGMQHSGGGMMAAAAAQHAQQQQQMMAAQHAQQKQQMQAGQMYGVAGGAALDYGAGVVAGGGGAAGAGGGGGGLAPLGVDMRARSESISGSSAVTPTTGSAQ